MRHKSVCEIFYRYFDSDDDAATLDLVYQKVNNYMSSLNNNFNEVIEI